MMVGSKKLPMRTLVLLALLTFGCNEAPRGPHRYETSGVVTHKGNPVADAMVYFISHEQHIFKGARTDAAGRFRVVAASGVGLPAGEYAMIVRPAPSSDLANSTPDRSDIPKKFRNKETSGLAVTVDEDCPGIEIEI